MKCTGLIKGFYGLISTSFTSLTFGPGDHVYSASLNLVEGVRWGRRQLKDSQSPAGLFRAGKTCLGVGRGPSPRPLSLEKDKFTVNKDKGLREMPFRTALPAQPSQSKPTVTNSLNGKYQGSQRVLCHRVGEENQLGQAWLWTLPSSLNSHEILSKCFASLSLNLWDLSFLRPLGSVNYNDVWKATGAMRGTG